MNRLSNAHTATLRAQDDQIRPLNQELKQKRDEAARQSKDLSTKLQDLQVALERVRGTSKSGLLSQVAELQKKVRELGARRKTNQRKLADAALDRRRLFLEREKVDEVRQTVGDYFSRDVLTSAEQTPALQKQARACTSHHICCTLAVPGMNSTAADLLANSQRRRSKR